MEKDIHFKTCKPETQGKLGGDCLLSLFFHIASPGGDRQKHLFCFDVF